MNPQGPDNSLHRGPERALAKGHNPHLAKGPTCIQEALMIEPEGGVCNTLMQVLCMREARATAV